MDPDLEPPPTRPHETLPSSAADLITDIDHVLITEELHRRPSRAPDYPLESRALSALAREMAVSPTTVLTRLAGMLVEEGIAASAGVTIVEPDNPATLRWVAIAGLWCDYVGGTIPLTAGPCGAVITRDMPLLFARPQEHFRSANVEPPISELLLVPFRVAGKPVGTVWTVSHDGGRPFEAEDLRLLTCLASFASAAYQMIGALNAAEESKQELEARVEARTHDLARSEERFRALISATAQIVWVADANGQVTEDSASWRLFTGQTVDKFLGWGWLDAVHREDREHSAQCWKHAVETVTPLDIEHRLYHAASGTWRPTRVRAVPLFRADGSIRGWVGMNVDITAEKQAAEVQQTLIAELQHRTRNLLALVHSVSGKTIDASSSLEDYEEQFNSRLSALSRVQAILSRSEGHRACVHEILEVELQALGAAKQGDRVAMSGPRVPLDSKAVQILMLVIHELATNAAKYGALSQEQAKLSIEWSTDIAPGREVLRLLWAETGVTLDIETSNTKRGFGRDLIENALPYDLGAQTHWELTKQGVCCELTLPLDRRHAGPEEVR